MHNIPFIPIIILIEGLVFWIILKKYSKIKVEFWKILLISLLANIVTSAIGTAFPIYRHILDNLKTIAIALVISLFIKLGIYIYFLRKYNVNKKRLFWTSFIVNIFSYIPITILLIIRGIN